MTATEFPSLEAFYNDRPPAERRYSPEADYGVHWHDSDRTWPSWRVSYVKATGEVCAVELRSPFRVRVLGVIPADNPAEDPGRHGGGWGRYYFTLDAILDGWADPDVSGHDLAWIERKLASR
jgi:hypothetical protein